MRVNLLLLVLCFLLLKLGGPVPAAAASAQQSALSSITHHDVFDRDLSIAHPAIAQSTPGDEYLYLISDDAEDDDVSEVLSRKFKILSRNYPALVIAIGSPANRSETAPYIFGKSDYKYLLQRVLRV